MSVTTTREDAVTVLLSTWTILGLFLDGWAHEHLRELESFFTPWHGVFYSGFVATALWIAKIVSDRRDGGPWWPAVPVGYRGAVVGVAAFTVGGVGDALWHTAFGVEATIDALLSPTHVVLFAGQVLILTAPPRAGVARATAPGGGDDGLSVPSWRQAGLPVASATLATSLVAFFFVYLWGPGATWVYRRTFDPITERGEVAVMAGIGAMLVATAVMVGPVLWLLQRWRTPRGGITVLFVTVNVLVVGAFDRDPSAVAAAFAAGVVADLLAVHRRDRRTRLRAVGAVTPVVLSATVFALQHAGPGVAWQPELWGGAIVFSGLLGLALAVLATPESPVGRPVSTAHAPSDMALTP